MRILVMRYRFIGDTILTVPFLRNLRRAHPGARIDMVVAPYSSDVIRGTPYVDEFLVYDPPTIHADSRGEHRGIAKKAAFARTLRASRYDKIYVLKRSLSSAVLAFLAGARERVGFDTERRGFLLTLRVPYRYDRHEVRNFLSVLEADGIPVADDHLEAWISPEEEAFAADRFATAPRLSGRTVVALHPFAANPGKTWHEDDFVAVANALQEMRDAGILIFGGGRDVEAARRMAGRIRPAPELAVGTTTLRQTMALLSRCDLLVCNDSGIMHLAAAVGTPLLALFGSENPVRFGPWSPRAEVIYKAFPCSPCRQKFFEECEPSPRGKPYCLEEISVDEVVSRADRILDARGR